MTHYTYYHTFYTCSLSINCSKKACTVLHIPYNDAFKMLKDRPRYCSTLGKFVGEHLMTYIPEATSSQYRQQTPKRGDLVA